MFQLRGLSLKGLAAAGLSGWVIATAATPPATPEQRVQAAAREVLDEQAARAGWIAPRSEVSVVKSSRQVPACAQPLTVETLDARYPSRMRFALVCAGPDGWRFDVVARATVSAEVLVAAADLPAGRVPGESDVALERRDVTALPDALADLQAADGLATRRAIRSGDVLRRSQLAAAVLVRRGAAVRIVARRGAVEVTVAGEALEAGSRGDLVRVRNTANGNVIQARVTGSGTVEPADMAESGKE